MLGAPPIHRGAKMSKDLFNYCYNFFYYQFYFQYYTFTMLHKKWSYHKNNYFIALLSSTHELPVAWRMNCV